MPYFNNINGIYRFGQHEANFFSPDEGEKEQKEAGEGSKKGEEVSGGGKAPETKAVEIAGGEKKGVFSRLSTWLEGMPVSFYLIYPVWLPLRKNTLQHVLRESWASPLRMAFNSALSSGVSFSSLSPSSSIVPYCVPSPPFSSSSSSSFISCPLVCITEPQEKQQVQQATTQKGVNTNQYDQSTSSDRLRTMKIAIIVRVKDHTRVERAADYDKARNEATRKWVASEVGKISVSIKVLDSLLPSLAQAILRSASPSS